MRLLIDDAFATQSYVLPVTSSWISIPEQLADELDPRLDADSVRAGDAALLPASELLRLHGSPAVVLNIAVVADVVGTSAMRTAVRPDEIEATAVRLLQA